MFSAAAAATAAAAAAAADAPTSVSDALQTIMYENCWSSSAGVY